MGRGIHSRDAAMRSDVDHISVSIGQYESATMMLILNGIPLSAHSVCVFVFAEAERLYQCLHVSFFSRNADVMPSEALKALRRLGGFTDMDFGYWRLSMGDVGTRWQGMAIFCALSDISPLCARCRVFVRREEDLVRLLGKVCDERR
ncbi:hypothetical protein Tcan_10191 [Toxocara canis]|uniref:Uncharacterized protein n=1 Tax=Toxocara canis TaxID=6265 RepID=A0A0B2UX32_TOXCA|nr:hypothetical protein Tcan_10191 [Toxocara canis]